MTVRKEYDAMIRERVAPWLRERSFKKQRNAFRRDGERGWQVVDFQASQFGSRDDVRFTINLRIGLPEISGTDSIIDERIGSLMPRGEDHWWAMDASTDVKELAEELRGVLEERALPWLDQRRSLDQLLSLAVHDPQDFPSWALGRFLILLNAAGFSAEAEAVERATDRDSWSDEKRV